MKLYGYWRSSASYRVRIALNLKGLAYESLSVNLKKGDQLDAEFLEFNPEAQVPLLELNNGTRLAQSLAILEYLEQAFPNPPLLSQNPMLRAQERAFAMTIASDIHPIQNLRVLKKLKQDFDLRQDNVDHWVQHWISRGFDALEPIAALRDTRFAFGEKPSLADLCLIPQIYNARRFGVKMSDYPALHSIDEECAQLDAFIRAAPEHQLDSEK